MHIHAVSDAPGELKVSHSLPTSAQLSWTPVPEDEQNGTIIGYIVQVERPYSFSRVNKKKIGFPVMDGNATSFEVSGLKPYTTYTFSVSAITKIDTGLAKSVSSTTPQGGEIVYFNENLTTCLVAACIMVHMVKGRQYSAYTHVH